MNDESRAAASAVSLVKLLTTGQVTPHEPLDVVSARCAGQSGDQCVCAARL